MTVQSSLPTTGTRTRKTETTEGRENQADNAERRQREREEEFAEAHTVSRNQIPPVTIRLLLTRDAKQMPP